MPSTYSQIATQTLGSTATSVTFSSIPQTYTNLVLVTSAINTGGATDLFLTINSDTGTNYSYTWITGTGSAASSGRISTNANMRMAYYGIPGSVFGSIITTHIPQYTNTTTFKSVLMRAGNANTGGGTDAIIGLWRNTSAINTLQIRASTGSFGIGSTFTLYGIKGA